MFRIRAGSVAFVLPVLLGGLVACGTQPQAKTDLAPVTTPSTTAPSPSQPDTAGPTPSLAPVGADATLAERLIPADSLPGFNDEWTWTEASTQSTPPDPIGVCAKVDPLSIGANAGMTRTYSPAGPGAGASMSVLDFPDTRTALRVVSVLKAWHDSCTERIKPRLKPRVEPIHDVTVPAGTGVWYLVTTTNRGPESRQDDGHFQALGMAVVGARMALLTMDHDGQDHNYEPGQDPMERAVALAASRL